jgi:valyl-tRNA synthetase
MRLAETRQHVNALEARLANDSYVAKAPAHLVEETRDELATKQALVQRLQDELTVLS